MLHNILEEHRSHPLHSGSLK